MKKLLNFFFNVPDNVTCNDCKEIDRNEEKNNVSEVGVCHILYVYDLSVSNLQRISNSVVTMLEYERVSVPVLKTLLVYSSYIT